MCRNSFTYFISIISCSLLSHRFIFFTALLIGENFFGHWYLFFLSWFFFFSPIPTGNREDEKSSSPGQNRMTRGKVHTWGAVRQIQELNKWQTRTPDGNFLKFFFTRAQRVFFSETLGMQRWSQTCSNKSGLSIAPTPDRFGHLHVKILTILQKSAQISLLKKNPQMLRIFISTRF